MYSIKSIACTVLLAGAALFSACENDNIDPTETGKASSGNTPTGSEEVLKTALASYPKGSIVWTKDTTLAASFKVPEGVSLYIEPGVTVTAASDADPKVELVVLGNLYCMGTADKPVTFTSDKKEAGAWGGVICGKPSTDDANARVIEQEVVMNHVDIRYCGAKTTDNSMSFMNKLYKLKSGDGVPAFFFGNVDGRFTVTNCVFRDNNNDQTYFTGGSCVIYGNVFADSGNSAEGGDVLNFKAGCRGDIAYNVIYNSCTNGFKLSNSGTDAGFSAAELNIYNNTIVNCGWRRSKNKKGGSIWAEKNIAPNVENNLMYDCRYAIKQDEEDGADMKNGVFTPNYFFSSTADGVKQNTSAEEGVMQFDTDIRSTFAGDKDPLFVKFDRTPGMDINCSTDDKSKGAPQAFNAAWDFHLKAGSPALNGKLPAITPLWKNGLVFIGLKKVIFNDINNDMEYRFYSPAPATYFGAYGLAD